MTTAETSEGMMRAPSCVRCSVQMAPGFVADAIRTNQRRVAQWVEGEPKRTFLFGVTTHGRRHYALTAFRCPRCGLLEIYAPQG